MGHTHTHGKYDDFSKRLNKMPQGAPATETLFKFLEVLLSESEAELLSVIPVKACPIPKVAKIWKKSEEETEDLLNGLADKGILIDVEINGKRVFSLAPPMAGFIEFSLMRINKETFDKKLLSELYSQYINVEDQFGAMLWNLEPAIDRCLVNEEAIPEIYQSEILDYERSSHIIETATCITVGTCYCRHKKEHIGEPCPQNMPQDVCLTFNNAAKSLSKHGIAKEISKQEAMEVLNRVRDLGLVQIGDNTQDGVSWICNCCGCCCEALNGYKQFGHIQNINTNFYAKVEEDECTGCGICQERCPVDAIEIVDGISVVDLERCIGCGVCTRFCETEAITLGRRNKLQFVPKDSFERVILEAISTGKLHNLVCDNWTSTSNQILNRLLKFIFKLKPVKRSMVEKQLKSRYITAMIKMYMKIAKEDLEGFDLANYDHPELKEREE